MLVLGRENWAKHRPWAISVAGLTLAALGWCLVEVRLSPNGRWPGGGSWPGLTLGVVGGLICLFELLLWPRKLLRRMRLGRTKHWMMAHLWLGLLCLPILLFHGGFRLNPSHSTLAVILLWLVLLVVASGLFGGLMQSVIPRMMLRELPAETILAQIPRILEQYAQEAAQMVQSASGGTTIRGFSVDPEGSSGFIAIGTIRSVGAVQGKVIETIQDIGVIAGADPLVEFHDQHVAPYLDLKSGRSARSCALHSPRQAAALFRELELRLPPAAQPTARRLADLCDQRRQFERQIQLDQWLHIWLVFHFALSMALLVLLVAHVILALRYP